MWQISFTYLLRLLFVCLFVFPHVCSGDVLHRTVCLQRAESRTPEEKLTLINVPAFLGNISVDLDPRDHVDKWHWDPLDRKTKHKKTSIYIVSHNKVSAGRGPVSGTLLMAPENEFQSAKKLSRCIFDPMDDGASLFKGH